MARPHRFPCLRPRVTSLAPGHRLQWGHGGNARNPYPVPAPGSEDRPELETKPEVILLCNPAGYEIYGIFWLIAVRNATRSPHFQIQAQKDFAEAHGWRFMDLTTPLRTKLETSKVWIYGQHDSTHWSRPGTTIVAEIMADEILKVMAH